MGQNLGFGTFQVTLTTAGTSQQVQKPSNIPGQENPQINSMVLRAMKSNGGVLYLGGSAAEAEAATGFELAAGDMLSIDISGGGKIWMNGTKALDKLTVAWTGP